MEDYTNIDRPYDSLLNREQPPTSDNTMGGATSGIENGSVEEQAVKTDAGMGDVWIKNFIRSTNWKPKTSGFTIDGATGYAEFANVFVSGEIEASSGTIGGFVIKSDHIRDAANSMGLASTVSASDDVRFWSGDTFANRASAPFRVSEAGNMAVSSLERNDYHWFTVFESLDGFSKGGNNLPLLNPDHVILQTTATSTHTSELQKLASYSNNFTWNKRRKMKCGIVFGTNTLQYIDIVTGGVSYGSDIRQFGFRVLNGTLYALSNHGAGEEATSIEASIAIGTIYELEARLNPGVDVTFYKNGSLVATHTLTVPSGSIDANKLLNVYIRTNETAQKDVKITYYDFWQQN